jgi:hypothetical protein
MLKRLKKISLKRHKKKFSSAAHLSRDRIAQRLGTNGGSTVFGNTDQTRDKIRLFYIFFPSTHAIIMTRISGFNYTSLMYIYCFPFLRQTYSYMNERYYVTNFLIIESICFFPVHMLLL